MLTSLQLSSFKCFEKLDLGLRPLTLLSGVNSGGKSSVIQAPVLLAQTFSEREWGRTLLLEGPDLALGSASDVLNQKSARRRFSLGLATASEKVQWTFKADDRKALSVELESAAIDGKSLELQDPVRWLLPASLAERSAAVAALRRSTWISAERTGPREVLPLRDAPGHNHVGARGELAAGLLYWRESDPVPRALCLPEVPPTLFHQVRARMQEFFPGCDLRVAPIDGASALTLRFRSNSRSDFQRPQNVGFGVTQLFPILVALLASEPGDLVIVENPEVHLHPAAQQRAGALLARAAASGLQVIVETHSDHVLNGVRLAAKQQTLAPSDVAVHFFSPESGSYVPKSPRLDADGRLDSWPEGFFDQFDLALSQLL